jgi:DNA polymerase
MEQVAHIDFESRSTIDLPKTGVYVYAKHKTTDLWCMSWSIGDGPIRSWRPGMDFPPQLRIHIEAGLPLFAHNAAFERVMWNEIGVKRYGFPQVRMEQWYCTAAMAAAMSLPRGLGEVAEVLGLSEQKDKEGTRLMQQMARPRSVDKVTGAITWWDLPEKIERLSEYCDTDVRVEREITKRLKPLSPEERAYYILDQIINDRGVHFDRDLAEAARDIIANAQDDADASVAAMTDDEVEKITQTGALVKWLNTQGIQTTSVDKASVAIMLDRGDLPNAVRSVLESRQEAGKSSVAKINSMLAYADKDDDRMRGMLLYHGASTGRWSAKGPQPHNFPRGEVKIGAKEIEAILTRDIAIIEAIESPFALVSSALRPMLCAAPGSTLIAGDFSAIEARVLAWCAGEDVMLEMFREGRDPYVAMAARTYGIPESEVQKFPHRQLGKATVLGCGFGMGGPRFVEQAGTYGVDIDEVFATNVVNLYRELNPRTVQWWNDTKHAATMAVKHPGKVFTSGPVKFAMAGPFLWCLLPSGRRLCYPSPRISVEMSDWGYETEVVITYGVDSRTRKWGPQKMWRGLWVENIVQAIARDLIASGMLRLEKAGYPVILSVHDEVVSEVPEDREEFAEQTLREFERIMCIVPPWAEGMPITAEAWIGKRYRK